MTISAGAKLKRSLDAELRRAGKAQGVVLAWTAAESAAIATAMRAADHAAALQLRFAAAAGSDVDDAAATMVLVGGGGPR
jgi:putative intracellular protease/amidase